MERTVKCSAIMLCLTLLYIVSINSQPPKFTPKASSKVNNDKKKNPGNSSTLTGASTHPYLFHNVEITKVKVTTHSVEVSTFPQLVREPFPSSPPSTQAVNTPLSTENPHFTISTHPPLLSEMKSTKRKKALAITSPPTRSTAGNAVTLEISTYPPPIRNPNLGISIHHHGKNNASTYTTIVEKNNNEKCAFAIVRCCPRVMAPNDKCFQLMGCPGPFWDKNPCDKDIIGKALKIVGAYYGKGA